MSHAAHTQLASRIVQINAAHANEQTAYNQTTLDWQDFVCATLRYGGLSGQSHFLVLLLHLAQAEAATGISNATMRATNCTERINLSLSEHRLLSAE